MADTISEDSKKTYTFKESVGIHKMAFRTGIDAGIVIAVIYLIDRGEDTMVREILDVGGLYRIMSCPVGAEKQDWKKIQRFIKNVSNY